MSPLTSRSKFDDMVASRLRSTRTLALLAVAVSLASPSPPADAGVLSDGPGRVFDLPIQKNGVAYRVEISGVEDKPLRNLLESSSQLLTLGDRLPPTLVALERRARGDVDRLQAVLRSEGYYAAEIDYRLERDEKPVRVKLTVKLAERYRLVEYRILYTDAGADAPGLPQDPVDLGVTLGEPARAEVVVGARRRLLELLADRGHPLAQVVDQRVLVDHADDSMSVSIHLIPGEEALFGPLVITGATSVAPAYIEGFIPWKEGERFERSRLNQARQLLLETGLFAAVAFERPNQLDAEGELPITLLIEERKHRSIGLAARWSTDEGIAFEAQWEHRNLFGRGERLSLDGEAGEIKQEFAAVFRKPRLLGPDQDLLLDAALAYEDTDAYKGPLTRYFGGIERRVTADWKIVAGMPIEFSNLDDLQGTRRFSLFGLEAQSERDTSNDRLDPNAGSRIRFSMTPYLGTGENRVNFLTAVLGLAGYYAVDPGEHLTLAGRARLGSSLGESTRALPANKRFYAGGGASIRGYRFQSVGPLGPGDTPLGGRSLLEVSAELRIRVTDSLGGVVFIDGGNVYDDPYPDPSENLRWAVGFGGRYFTTFGPIRLDFGFPLNRRDRVDDLMQFYISIGQAF